MAAGSTDIHNRSSTWMRVTYKKDGTSFYEYVLYYVDDLLCISADPAAILGCVEQTYQLKEKPCEPERFLGATIKEFYFQGDAKPRWAFVTYSYDDIAHLGFASP